MKAPLTLAAFASLISLALIMAAVQVTARIAMDSGADPATLLASRSAVAAAALLLLIWLFGTRSVISPRQARALSLIGLLIGLQSLCLLAAVARLPVGLAMLAFNTYPICALVWSRLVYRRSPDADALFAASVIFTGLALALDASGSASGLGATAHWAHIGLGVALALVGGALYALALLITENETVGMDARVRGAAMFLVAAVVGAAAIAQQGGVELPRQDVGWIGFGGSILLYALGLTTIFALLPRLGVASNSPLMNIEPVFALLLAWQFLGQSMQPLQLLGAAIVVAGVIWLGLRRARTAVPIGATSARQGA